MTEGPTVDCMFTCLLCGANRVKFTVEARRPGEDVIKFVSLRVRNAMGAAHKAHSPACIATSCDLYIPMEGDRVGGPRLN